MPNQADPENTTFTTKMLNSEKSIMKNPIFPLGFNAYKICFA